MLSDPIRVALLVAEALEACGLRFLAGGSLASSISGEPRSTLDVDLVVDLAEAQIEPRISALGDGFYADPAALRRAVRDHLQGQLDSRSDLDQDRPVHLRRFPLDAEQLDRRQRVKVATDPDRHLYVYTPEDILLQKLRWYRMGNEVSDRQWRDILGIVLVQERRLDEPYLQCGAKTLGVTDLVVRAPTETHRG